MSNNSEITLKLSKIFSNGQTHYSPEVYNYNSGKETLDFSILDKTLLDLNKTTKVQNELFKYFKKNGYNFFSYLEILYSHKRIENTLKNEVIPYLRIGLSKKEITLFKELTITPNLTTEITNTSLQLFKDIKSIKVHQKIKEGNYDIVFSSSSSAYLIHEIFGHLLEKDESHHLFKFINIGDQILNNTFTLKDDPFYKKEIHFGNFDDSGKKYQTTTLIDKGILKQCICTKRSSNLSEPSLNRMTNLVLNGNKTVNFENIEDFLYIDYVYHGYIDYISGEFHLFASLGKVKENGHEEVYNNLTVSGYIKDLINNIDIYDTKVSYSLGNCIKKNQILLVGMAAPSLYIKNLQVR